MINEEKKLGIGGFEIVLECNICQNQLHIGSINRTDGTGEETRFENFEEQEKFFKEHENCDFGEN